MTHGVRPWLAIGLAGLVALGAAICIGITLASALTRTAPDADAALRTSRIALARTVVGTSTESHPGAPGRKRGLLDLESVLGAAVAADERLTSGGVRDALGHLLIEVGDHASHWTAPAYGVPTAARVTVPIPSLADPSVGAGQLELRFVDEQAATLPGRPGDRLTHLALFVAALCVVILVVHLRGRRERRAGPETAPELVLGALDAVPDGLLVLDDAGGVVLANQTFARMAGASADALVGRRAADLPWRGEDGHLLDFDDLPWLLPRQLPGHRDGEDETTAHRVSLGGDATADAARMLEVRCVAGPGSGPGAHGVLLALRELAATDHAPPPPCTPGTAAAMADARSAFLANVSHEIRTPMNVIMGLTDVLRREYQGGSDPVRRHLDGIHTSGAHLLALIADILEFTRVESGQLELERSRFSPHATVREVVEALQATARQQGIGLDLVVDGPVPETIESDRARLRRIVTNLVGNALKFTEAGKVTVTERFAPGVQPTLDVEVRDSGVGVPREGQEAIFEPFVQADASTTRRHGGAGLGLAICRRFARALGGDIALASEPGMGSVFTVSLPTGPLEGVRLLAPAQLPSPGVDDGTDLERGDGGPSRARPDVPGARVLVVDDGIENRQLARLILEEAGITVDEAPDGRIGVEMALAGRYDAILMDVQMPEMDGLRATRALRDASVETPIIALTANATREFEQRCLTAGYSAYLAKPVQFDALLDTLAGCIADGRPGAGAPSAQCLAPRPSPARDDQDTAPIRCSLAVERPGLGAIAEQFMASLGDRLTAIEQALDAGDLTEVARLGHALRGTAGSIGFGPLGDAAHALEDHAGGGDAQAAANALVGLRRMQPRLSLGPAGERDAALKIHDLPADRETGGGTRAARAG